MEEENADSIKYLKYFLLLINTIGMISSLKSIKNFGEYSFAVNAQTGELFITNQKCLPILFILCLSFVSFFLSFIKFRKPRLMAIFSFGGIILLFPSLTGVLVRSCVLK